MNCKEVQTFLHGYLDNELDPIHQIEIDSHLRGCAVCSRSYDNQVTLQKFLRGSNLSYKAPASLQQRLLDALPEEEITSTRFTMTSARWLRAAAVVLLLGFLVFGTAKFTQRNAMRDLIADDVVACHIRSLMPNHLIDIASTSQHTVKPWFNGKVDFSPTVVDLAPEGYPLIGGRLDYVAQHPVAALIYRHNKHLINVFTWPSAQDAAVVQADSARQGYHVLYWTKYGMTCWAVSDLNLPELQDFVRDFQTKTPSAP